MAMSRNPTVLALIVTLLIFVMCVSTICPVWTFYIIGSRHLLASPYTMLELFLFSIIANTVAGVCFFLLSRKEMILLLTYVICLIIIAVFIKFDSWIVNVCMFKPQLYCINHAVESTGVNIIMLVSSIFHVSKNITERILIIAKTSKHIIERCARPVKVLVFTAYRINTTCAIKVAVEDMYMFVHKYGIDRTCLAMSDSLQTYLTCKKLHEELLGNRHG